MRVRRLVKCQVETGLTVCHALCCNGGEEASVLTRYTILSQLTPLLPYTTKNAASLALHGYEEMTLLFQIPNGKSCQFKRKHEFGIEDVNQTVCNSAINILQKFKKASTRRNEERIEVGERSFAIPAYDIGGRMISCDSYSSSSECISRHSGQLSKNSSYQNTISLSGQTRFNLVWTKNIHVLFKLAASLEKHIAWYVPSHSLYVTRATGMLNGT